MNRKPSTAMCRLLADNLIRLRTARALTQAQLAAACGLTRNYISNVEQATVNISLANLEALTVGLHCSPADLLTRPATASTPHGAL
jgi:transcriptional regulator with XRE-family HTH domain